MGVGAKAPSPGRHIGKSRSPSMERVAVAADQRPYGWRSAASARPDVCGLTPADGRMALALGIFSSPRFSSFLGGAAGARPGRRHRAPRADAVFNCRLPHIEHLVITGGAISVVDGRHRLSFAGRILTNERRGRAQGPNDSIIKGALVVGSPAGAGIPPLVDAPHLLIRVSCLG